MERSPLLERHRASGARLAPQPEAPGVDVALTFGDVPAEYAAARERVALFDATDRGRVTVRGREAEDFLHRILANRVKGLAVGRGNLNLLLSPKGKVLHAFELARLEERFELSTPPGQEATLRRALDGYLFAEDVQLETSGAQHAPLELCGPAASSLLARLLGQWLELEPHETRAISWKGAELLVSALSIAGSRGFRIDGGAEFAPVLWEELCGAGAVPAGLVARESLRVEAGEARSGVDIDENVYPQEARLESAFALDKGCYVGQEVVAKIDTYGGLNKRLEALRVDHDDPIPHGTVLRRGDESGTTRELGLVTSWAYSFVLDTGLVLGYVKRKHQDPGTEFELGDDRGRATVVVLPVRPDALGS